MFEIGKRYNFRIIRGDDRTSHNGTVVGVDGPLIRLSEDGEEWIFNTHNSAFESASENPEGKDSADLDAWLRDMDQRL